MRAITTAVPDGPLATDAQEQSSGQWPTVQWPTTSGRVPGKFQRHQCKYYKKCRSGTTPSGCAALMSLSSVRLKGKANQSTTVRISQRGSHAEGSQPPTKRGRPNVKEWEPDFCNRNQSFKCAAENRRQSGKSGPTASYGHRAHGRAS